ncbi:MAG: hypothetical protein RIS09_652 [Actinomycetota bacterium]
MNDHELAADIAKKAAHLVLDIRAESKTDYTDREATKALANLADTSANELLIAAIAAHRPDDAILSEESKDTDARLSAKRVWIIDPVDGTYEYSHALPECAIHVALWDTELKTFLAGAVALPDHDFVWRMDIAGPTIQREGRGQPFIVIASPREDKVLLKNLMSELESKVTDFGFAGVELDHCGSVGGKTYRVLSGQAEVYVSSAGFNEWDSAAPTAVGLAQGLQVSDMEGQPLMFNAMPPITPSFVATWPEHHAMVIDCLKQRRTWT